MHFYRITIELAGKTITGLRKHDHETDSAFLAFRVLAEKAYGSKLLYFDCVQLSSYSDEVKLHIKQKGKTGKTTLEHEDDFGLPIDKVPRPGAKGTRKKFSGHEWKKPEP